ncbi:histone-fold-containing protein [Hesseltinella vesiculosa]|uniref:Histone-fold-containing protein n=1 Tax=Hesseltinella vesiculosa TaxID=101127 RepID=A0A1X2G509_9FUNG|nr:histone-fold-containing protein [Hesseltinella vesiculosa]
MSDDKSERTPGQSYLPLARVKRIIKLDKDIAMINAEATQTVCLATELFMEYLANEGYTTAQKAKRKTIYYKDLADVVGKTEAFQFLEDVVPQTITLEEGYRRRKKAGIDDGVEITDEPSQKRQRKKKSTQGEDEPQATNGDTDKDMAESTPNLVQDSDDDNEEDQVEALDDDIEDEDNVEEEEDDDDED